MYQIDATKHRYNVCKIRTKSTSSPSSSVATSKVPNLFAQFYLVPEGGLEAGHGMVNVGCLITLSSVAN